MAESYISKRKKEKTEVTLKRKMVRDPRLKLQTKGLLTVLMSMDDDDIMTMEYIRTLSEDGETSHRTAMRQLEELGYMLKRRLVDEKGQFCGWEYIIDDEVWVDEDKRKIHTNKPKRENQVSPKSENQVSEENDPKRENPVSENHVYNQKDLKDDLNKDDLIDCVFNKLVQEFPQLTKEDVIKKYEYCLQYKPEGMPMNYLEQSMRKALTAKKRSTRKIDPVKKPIRVELVPDWYDKDKTKNEAKPLTSEEDAAAEEYLKQLTGKI